MAESSKPALVTGASGFVGSAVARALLAEGRQVRVLLRSGSDRRNLAGLAVEIRSGSLEDHASLGSALEGCGALFHVAADYRLWVRDPAAMYRANVEGTRALMEAALTAGVERVVYTSSVAVLGLKDDGSDAEHARRHDRSLQALEVPRRAGARGAGARARPAGGHRRSLDADRSPRHQADAYRTDDRRGGVRAHAGLRRYRAQPRSCGRCRGRPSAGGAPRPRRRALYPRRRESE